MKTVAFIVMWTLRIVVGLFVTAGLGLAAFSLVYEIVENGYGRMIDAALAFASIIAVCSVAGAVYEWAESKTKGGRK